MNKNIYKTSKLNNLLLTIFLILASVAGASAADAYFMKHTKAISGFISLAFLLFSAAIFIFTVQRFRFKEIVLDKDGIEVSGFNGYSGIIPSGRFDKLSIRKSGRKYSVSAPKKDGGFIDLNSKFSASSAQKELDAIFVNFSNKNADDLIFSPAVERNEQNIISWWDGYTPFFRLGLAFLLSGFMLAAGTLFAGDAAGFYFVPGLAVFPWLYFAWLFFRDSGRKIAFYITKSELIFGYLKKDVFHAKQKITSDDLLRIYYSFDLTVSLQYLHAEYEEGSVKISLPGISIHDGETLGRLASEIMIA
ncbi:MAG: hypothetical protein OEZ34_05655 [Spirochaetia bacterium]|nr:hypothetical protein [Spirochaetia bacterium]